MKISGSRSAPMPRTMSQKRGKRYVKAAPITFPDRPPITEMIATNLAASYFSVAYPSDG